MYLRTYKLKYLETNFKFKNILQLFSQGKPYRKRSLPQFPETSAPGSLKNDWLGHLN